MVIECPCGNDVSIDSGRYSRIKDVGAIFCDECLDISTRNKWRSELIELNAAIDKEKERRAKKELLKKNEKNYAKAPINPINIPIPSLSKLIEKNPRKPIPARPKKNKKKRSASKTSVIIVVSPDEAKKLQSEPTLPIKALKGKITTLGPNDQLPVARVADPVYVNIPAILKEKERRSEPDFHTDIKPDPNCPECAIIQKFGKVESCICITRQRENQS